ncbi:hypothetical protein E5288_WYG018663 [Bos mutus]|uniref:C2H2-type domain-containing protein n=1 Tax=Bos mutus TaxID=72004 RepID=A0A6B0R027_9CETA|nr:hypothetical protein [Bos mutus]
MCRIPLQSRGLPTRPLTEELLSRFPLREYSFSHSPTTESITIAYKQEILDCHMKCERKCQEMSLSGALPGQIPVKKNAVSHNGHRKRRRKFCLRLGPGVYPPSHFHSLRCSGVLLASHRRVHSGERPYACDLMLSQVAPGSVSLLRQRVGRRGKGGDTDMHLVGHYGLCRLHNHSA